MIKLQTQPNRASCLATSFAMCINEPVESIFELLKHDGTELAFPSQEVPLSYRAFHITEMIWVAQYFGHHVIELPKRLGVSNGLDSVVEIKPPYNLEAWLKSHKAVLVKGKHAVAWWAGKIYCPSGVIRDCAISDVLESYEEFYFVDYD